MEIIDFITEIPLFKGLPERQIVEISKIALNHSFNRGQTVFSEGDEANGFYVLLSGRIKIFKLSPEGKEQILHIFESGEPFGEAAVFAGETFPAYAETLEESEVIFFPRKAFMELIKRDPSLTMNMLAILSLRLKHFTRLVEDLSLKEVPQRLAAYLLYLSESKNEPNNVELEILKGQLASLLGTIPETLSRILSKMASQGFIQVQGRKIKLLDRKALKDLASGEKFLL
ncbi:MAG: Crp/Fnr family transcriptional regulator [Proteobacteria bacterium]|nr:Crp/Fnr family transcriptional regulator [Pseudomonadota bacterium]